MSWKAGKRWWNLDIDEFGLISLTSANAFSLIPLRLSTFNLAESHLDVGNDNLSPAKINGAFSTFFSWIFHNSLQGPHLDTCIAMAPIRQDQARRGRIFR